jgi:diguanylate cyclase (GGDEF)-like protein
LQVVIRRNEEIDPELAREVEELRLRDPATGLLNRPSFLRMLEDTVAQVGRGEGGNFGFLVVEADHYTQLLSDIGLDSADAFVAELGAYLSATLEGNEMQIARFGEQTFALLMQGGYAHTVEISEKIRGAFASQVFNIGARSASVTVSIGGVQIGEKIASLNAVLTRAAESLQTSQDVGGNSVHIFDPSASDRMEEERVELWVTRVREALAGEGFALSFQPVISLQGEPLEFYEVFLRMSVNDELISPAVFINIAEEHGLLELIDMWVIKHAITAIGERKKMGHTTRLLVKLSPGSFANPNLVHMIERELAIHGVPGDLLWLQTTEAKVFTHLRSAQQFVEMLAPLGCKMGLEQFGSGLDSFQLLNHLRPAFIKIDHSITDDLVKSPELQEKVAGFAQRAHEENMYILAEHVQDAPSMTQLFSAGIDYVSGEFISMPTPAMNFDFS